MQEGRRALRGIAGRRGALLAVAAATALVGGGSATAGTPGPTVSLGKAKGLEYMRATFENVVSQAGAPAHCDGARIATGGGGLIGGGDTGTALHASEPTSPEEGWRAEGSTVTAEPRVVKTWAVCGKEPVDHLTATDNYPSGAELNETATCDDGMRATSGGLSSSGSGAVIAGMGPAPADIAHLVDWVNSFRVIAITSQSVRRTALCTSAYTLRHRAETSKARPGEIGKAIARCKPDEAVAGGGLRSTDDTGISFEAWAVASKPWDSRSDAKKVPEDGWLAKAYNDGDANLDLAAYAVCKRPG